MKNRGLFVGLITGDLIYLATRPPLPNEKVEAMDYCFTVGGPAANAAITFSHHGSQADLASFLGTEKLSLLLGDELRQHGINMINMNIEKSLEPPISSVIVTESTGDRSVISLNAKSLSGGDHTSVMQNLHTYDVILVDGHLMDTGAVIARKSNELSIPVVVDAGSWKPNFHVVLKYTDFAICSENFLPPNCKHQTDVVVYLQNLGVSAIAITQGQRPIRWWQGDRHGEIPVPQVKVVDTLGAGDIFHGAFCHYILEQDFVAALASAAEVASYACQFFGTRKWLEGDRFRSQ
ncbi:PfkB domain protein [[Leptolyngbya] sp. PCC 7376]|uniref:PfkB family carbohydrate kinase n=1 Tax=[Leptolyngbya] sp. PCC 7376 TaxID=111781 RepID=UPI00029EF3C4|nr:PfkB family carbohydrate kinase [[Leptolyngbya] sp. PCC 7376]AFY37230.1 PfkB domain protein [[Leptolyngbya] sp. PCC 7376]